MKIYRHDNKPVVSHEDGSGRPVLVVLKFSFGLVYRSLVKQGIVKLHSSVLFGIDLRMKGETRNTLDRRKPKQHHLIPFANLFIQGAI
jgi:hypothetical protein